MNPFRNFLAVLPPSTLYKVETRKKFWIHASNIVLGVRGGVWTCVNWKTPQKSKSVPRLLSMIVVIYGNNVEQYHERLFVVLNRLKEVDLTLNGDKCVFRLPRLTFFGHQVTQNGVEPSEEKVAAIRNADPPQNASEARSFLGLAQFVSKFIPDLSTVETLSYLETNSQECGFQMAVRTTGCI